MESVQRCFSHFQPESYHFILALSGGLDSRVLLRMMGIWLKANPMYSCRAVHVHHGLSQNANEWAKQCLKWSKEEGIDCVVEEVQLQLGAQISIEAEARKWRYQALMKHVNLGDILLTAQHADDQIETFLLALKRGSGPAGLASMPFEMTFGHGRLIRPLLHLTRDELVVWAAEQQLQWIEDESNQDTRYDRNFLRHQVVPVLRDRWPSIHKAVLRSAQLCGEQEALLAQLLNDKVQQAIQNDGSLSLDPLTEELMGLAIIRQWLKAHDQLMPSQAQLKQIWSTIVLAQEDANPKVVLGKVSIRRFQQRLYLVQDRAELVEDCCPLVLNQCCVLPDGLGVISLSNDGDMGELRLPHPHELVTVRFNPEGMEVKPVGRSGKRKLKKLFQEYGVPSWLRRRTPLIFYGDQLAMVAGVFVVEGFQGDACTLAWDKSE